MEQARLVLPALKSSGKKYDVLYMNTPFSTLDVSSIGKLPVNDLTEDNAAMFMWVDSHSVSKAMSLVSKWGLEFHSVFQVVDYASYPWMKVVKDNKETNEVKKEDDMEVDIGDGSTVKEDKKPKTKSKRVVRVPPVNFPSWWTSSQPSGTLSSRPTTEQLWLVVKGDASKLFGTSTLTTHVVNMPELGRRSKSKKSLDSEDTERPLVFMETVLSCLVDSNVKVLSLFSSSVKTNVDSWGPGVPGGFQYATSSGEGLVGKLSTFFKSLKKTQLQVVSSGMSKWSGLVDEEKAALLKTMGSTWESIEKTLVSVGEDSKFPYNWRTDSSLPEDWMCKLLHTLSSDHVTNFSSNHQRKKKRKTSVLTGPRPRYGIACPTLIPSVLADFLKIPHDEKIARTQVVSRINEYIQKNNLQNPEDRTIFMLDASLKTILSPPDGREFVKYFELSTLVGKHFPTKKKKAEEAAAVVGDEKVDTVVGVEEPLVKKAKVEV